MTLSEKIAKALCRVTTGCNLPCDGCEERWQYELHYADAVLAALDGPVVEIAGHHWYRGEELKMVRVHGDPGQFSIGDKYRLVKVD